RFSRDWSSDVCSSDLAAAGGGAQHFALSIHAAGVVEPDAVRGGADVSDDCQLRLQYAIAGYSGCDHAPGRGSVALSVRNPAGGAVRCGALAAVRAAGGDARGDRAARVQSVAVQSGG